MPSLKDFSGSWHMSKDLSDDVAPVLAIQGFNSLTRSAISKAPVNITVTNKSPDEVEIKQTTTASIPGVTEQWMHDWEWREFDDKLFGKLKSRSRWVKGSVAGGAEQFLKEGVKEAGIGGEDELVEAEVQGLEGGWMAKQVWYFEGEKFVRRVVTSKEKEKAETKLVYEKKE